MADPSAPQTLMDRLAALERDVRVLRSPRPQPPVSSYEPVWTQGATIARTGFRNEFTKFEGLVSGATYLGATSAGTASVAFEVSAPFSSPWGSTVVVGAGWHYNGTVNLPLVVYLNTFGMFRFQPAFTATTPASAYGVSAVYYTSAAGANTSYTPTVASGHELTFLYQFEATV